MEHDTASEHGDNGLKSRYGVDRLLGRNVVEGGIVESQANTEETDHSVCCKACPQISSRFSSTTILVSEPQRWVCDGWRKHIGCGRHQGGLGTKPWVVGWAVVQPGRREGIRALDERSSHTPGQRWVAESGSRIV